MALSEEPHSPFSSPGAGKAKPLFGDTPGDIEPFRFPFVSCSTPVFSAVSSNSVYSISHSSPKSNSKYDLTKSLTSFANTIQTDSIGLTGEDTRRDKNENINNEIHDSLEKDDDIELKSADVNTKLMTNQNRGEFKLTNEDDSSDNEDLVECGNCDNEFQSLQEYMDHTCAGNRNKIDEKDNTKNTSEEKCGDKNKTKDLSDVESFDGKIVYNPDGSAYIIEGDSDCEIESFIDSSQKDGMIIDKKGKCDSIPVDKEIPLIDNAFFVPRNPNSYLYNPFMLPPKSQSTPIMHSYRVYDLRSKKNLKSTNSGDTTEENQNSRTTTDGNAESTTSSNQSAVSQTVPFPSPGVPSVPTKPILMCFICKLSFGYAKSFISHAITEHSMDLTEEERVIMTRKNSSAIIQGIGKEKEPLMSFLEPIKSTGLDLESKLLSSPNNKPSDKPASLAKETTSVSYIYTKPKLSDSYEFQNSPVSQKPGKDPSIREIRSQLVSQRFDCDSPSSRSANTPLSHLDRSSENDPESSSKRFRLDTSDDSNSQSSFPLSSIQKYMQDRESSQSSKSFMPGYGSSPRNFFGVCEEHPNGRAAGVECPSCDMILGSSQSLGGHMTMMHSRNSCKTLKCPKCNWHYKYQETLEIHMKEKHPEGDQKCMYCLTNQSHPRLARGESYSCGYKPYRCEVCNYSTTTKGNLSIHMQSDKHLNNVQDLANSGGDLAQFSKHSAAMAGAAAAAQGPPSAPQTPHLPPSPSPAIKTPPHQQLLQQHQQHIQQQQQQQQQSSGIQQESKKLKPKPTWRCDVCNYETNVARNLRIHMTSEKHTHNMMVLQQNMNHMKRDMQLHQQMNQLVMLQQDPSFLGLSGPIPGGITFPYDGSMMMGGLPNFGSDGPVDLSKENGIPGGNPLQDVNRLFQCCVCNVFGSDSLESLHQHLQMDRTKSHEGENISVTNGTYMCNLCQYKTTLKANFQLHCKTDKHIQRLQLVNHIKEGGANNDWRLKYLNVSNPVQVRCNCCDYYTNSIHKLQIHTGNPRHEASAQLFCHLQQQDHMIGGKKEKYYSCVLCKFNSRTKLALMQHVHSVQHLHSEGLKQMEMRETGQQEVDIGDIFTVHETQDLDDVKFDDESQGSSSITSKLFSIGVFVCCFTLVSQFHLLQFLKYHCLLCWF